MTLTSRTGATVLGLSFVVPALLAVLVLARGIPGAVLLGLVGMVVAGLVLLVLRVVVTPASGSGHGSGPT